MSMIHDNIKIKYVNDGYLPNWPYHLISDEEMLDAFMNDVVIDRSECHYDSETTQYVGTKFVSGTGYFFDNYPLLTDDLSQQYCDLLDVIMYFINLGKSQIDDKGHLDALPDWIYSYMLGEVISINSDYRDIHDLIKPLGVDNIDDEFTKCAEVKCYEVSSAWVKKYNHSDYAGRLVCLTGDFEYEDTQHITALLRANGIPYTFTFTQDVDYVVVGGAGTNIKQSILDSASIYNVPILTESYFLLSMVNIFVPINDGPDTRSLSTRPATMFGEPHVLKSLRLQEAGPSEWGTYPYVDEV